MFVSGSVGLSDQLTTTSLPKDDDGLKKIIIVLQIYDFKYEFIANYLECVLWYLYYLLS